MGQWHRMVNEQRTLNGSEWHCTMFIVFIHSHVQCYRCTAVHAMYVIHTWRLIVAQKHIYARERRNRERMAKQNEKWLFLIRPEGERDRDNRIEIGERMNEPCEISRCMLVSKLMLCSFIRFMIPTIRCGAAVIKYYARQKHRDALYASAWANYIHFGDWRWKC